MSEKTRKILILGAIFFTLLLIVSIVLSRAGSPKYSPTSQKEPEKGGPKTVVISNTGKLAEILLFKQFVAVRDETVAYIQSRVDNNAEKAALVGQPEMASNGLVSFVVGVEGSGKQFSVTVDRNTFFDKLIYSVPSDSYSKTIPVFSAPSD